MTLILWFFRILILLLIVRFVVTMVRQAMGSGRPATRERVPRRPTERIGGALVQDPQCGTYLPKDRAVAATMGGETHYFCSDRCRDEWTRKSA